MKAKFEQNINFIKNHCDNYISEVRQDMIKTNWTWHDSTTPPTEEEIRAMLYLLLDNIYRSRTRSTSCGGFTIFRDKDDIKCYFGQHSGQRQGLFLCSPLEGDPVQKYISYLSQKYHILDREMLEKAYKEMNI